MTTQTAEQNTAPKFINYVSGDVSVTTYRKPGCVVCELADVLEAVENESDESLVCDFDGAQDALCDGEYLASVNASQEAVEKLFDIIAA